MKKSTLEQWLHFLNMPASYTRFTNDLYEAMYSRGGFIAHFDRAGFFKARFGTLGAFDETLKMMRKVPELKELTEVATIPEARFKIAQLEHWTMLQQVKVIEEHARNLQSKFIREF
jgi:hypothetical protein